MNTTQYMQGGQRLTSTQLSNMWAYVRRTALTAVLSLMLGIGRFLLRLVALIAEASSHTNSKCASLSSRLYEARGRVLISRERLSPQGMSYEESIGFVKAIYSSGHEQAEADISESQQKIGSDRSPTMAQLSKQTRRADSLARNGTAMGFGEGGDGLIR